MGSDCEMFDLQQEEANELRELNELDWENSLEDCLRTLKKTKSDIERDRKSAEWKLAIALAACRILYFFRKSYSVSFRQAARNKKMKLNFAGSELQECSQCVKRGKTVPFTERVMRFACHSHDQEQIQRANGSRNSGSFSSKESVGLIFVGISTPHPNFHTFGMFRKLGPTDS